MKLEKADPKGLVRESYAIEGITLEECRSIFIDWALSLAADVAAPEALTTLIAHYAQGRPEHPMSGVLKAALAAPEVPRRRGGRAGRTTG